MSEMTPEGYVREWVRNGSKSPARLPAWEVPYQKSGLIEEAERLGYLRIGSDVACTITLTEKGYRLVDPVAAAPVQPEPKIEPICQPKRKLTPAERTKRWRKKNAEKHAAYMRQYAKDRRARSSEDRDRSLHEALRARFEGKTDE